MKFHKLTFYVLLIFLTAQPLLFGQIVRLNLDQKLTYKFEDDERSYVYYFSSEGSSPVVYSQINKSWRQDNYPTVFWNYDFKGKTYQLGGDIVNGKYFTNPSYSEASKESRNYVLSDELWTLEHHDDCKMMSVRVDPRYETRFYFFNLNDGVDYSKVNNFIVQNFANPAIQNFNEKLGKGWVLVYGEHFLDEETRIGFMGELIDETDKTPQEFIYNQKEIEVTLGGSEEEYEAFALAMPYPVYCEVFGLNEGVDEATYEEINTFFSDMCNYFNVFGRYDVKEFEQYFLNEIDRRDAHFRNEGILSEKQLSTFRKELLEYKNSNKESELIRDE